MYGVNLENYIDSLDTLPSEMRKKFNNMRDLDKKVIENLKTIDVASQTYLNDYHKLASTERAELYKNINKKYKKCKDMSDTKIQLAVQTYEMIDKHIRRLDAELAKFEAKLKHKASLALNSSMPQQTNTDGACRNLFANKSVTLSKDQKRKGKGKAQKATSSSYNDASTPAPTPVPGLDDQSLELLMPTLSTFSHSSQILDMPVDPNEPTYCVCHQVSYGEMIGCDNPDCPVEWFHFGCVGLTHKPKGKWFCPNCNSIFSGGTGNRNNTLIPLNNANSNTITANAAKHRKTS